MRQGERRLSVVSLDSGLESDGVGANDLADLLAVLVEKESGHGAHALLLGDLGDLVDVDLVEAGVGVVVGEPVEREYLLVWLFFCSMRVCMFLWCGSLFRVSFWAGG